MKPKPTQAELDWRGQVPVSSQFDDPYYSLDDGLSESRFVFLDGASIMELAAAKDQLTIGETGFGTGLNFLATWHAWREAKPQCRLTFVSAEAHPMSIADMAMAHEAFPELASFASELRDKMPPPAPGFHPIHFDDGKVNLLLLIGDAADSFRRLRATIDAWYLDGFAPAKNPGMWSDALFSQMARLSAPKATLATFTAAGFVRRGLAAHGFDMRKAPGYGRKRERLLGTFGQTPRPPTKGSPPAWAPTPTAPHTSVAVIGTGIAGASVAAAFSRRGDRVTLIGSETEGLGCASRLPAAILAPRFLLDEQPERAFFNAAFAYAVNSPAYRGAAAQNDGLQLVARSQKDRDRFAQIAERYRWPQNWLSFENGNLTLPRGGTIDPIHLLSNLTQGHGTLAAFVERIFRQEGVWHIFGDDDRILCSAATIVLAAGAETVELLKRSGLTGDDDLTSHPRLRPNAGQIEVIAATAMPPCPKKTLSYGGYVSAALPGNSGEFRTIGSSFERLNDLPSAAPEPTAENTKTIIEAFEQAIGMSDIDDGTSRSWTGLRATVPDHLPYAGPVPDWQDLETACAPLVKDATDEPTYAPAFHQGLYCLAGLGSKGFQYAPLLGEYLAAMVCGDPLPIPTELIGRLHPARSLVRDMVRRGTR